MDKENLQIKGIYKDFNTNVIKTIFEKNEEIVESLFYQDKDIDVLKLSIINKEFDLFDIINRSLTKQGNGKIRRTKNDDLLLLINLNEKINSYLIEEILKTEKSIKNMLNYKNIKLEFIINEKINVSKVIDLLNKQPIPFKLMFCLNEKVKKEEFFENITEYLVEYKNKFSEYNDLFELYCSNLNVNELDYLTRWVKTYKLPMNMIGENVLYKSDVENNRLNQIYEKKREEYLSWDEYFMALAKLTAKRSKDPSTQVGACIVSSDNRILSIGYNGAPNGFDDEKFPWDRSGNPLDTKYMYVCHGEMNAILNYRGSRKELEGAKIYVDLFPCNECAKLIIQSGINEVIYLSDKYKETDGVIASKRMFDTCGVSYRQLKEENQKVLTLSLKIDK